MELNKKQFRENALQIRNCILLSERKRLDHNIFSNVHNSSLYRQATVIFIYVSFKSEVDTTQLIQTALLEGKKVCVPKVISKSDGMKAYYITSFAQLEIGKYKIKEPISNQEAKPEDIDLAIIPGAAFDKTGRRIGYGGGFYDRYLAGRYKMVKTALAYEQQVYDKVPADDHDVLMDYIITNNEIIKCVLS